MPANPETQVELVPAAPEQESVLANLLELYIHDFSAFHPLELDANGRFGYPSLPLYRSDPGRYAFLIQVDGKLAGLAFVKRGSESSENNTVWDVAEFFIVRAYRRRGIGMKAAHLLWKQFPGPWEVRVMEPNHSALNFWQHAIAAWNGGPIYPARIEKDGQSWFVFVFESRAKAE